MKSKAYGLGYTDGLNGWLQDTSKVWTRQDREDYEDGYRAGRATWDESPRWRV
jgi:hypothetical protein